MLFNTVEYAIFLILVLVINYILPKKVRYIWLLVSSYYFYMQWNPWYCLLILGTTVVTYISGILIDKSTIDTKNKVIKKALFVFCLTILLGILGYFKYYDFFILYCNRFLHLLGVSRVFSRKFTVLLPVGISFYILQSLGYVIDVYRGDISPQKNFLMYALFVSFFPQLVAGPIERSSNLMRQLQNPEKLTWNDFRKGLLLILFGLFCKIVIADRIAVIVQTVYSNLDAYSGVYIIYAAVLFSFQIYCDFYGYSTIARGSAKLIGISLVDNFNAPYFSLNIKEFWRRWHISLSSWFKDYLYIPLGGNRRDFGRNSFNLLLVFGISGLWHGASLSFVFWGLINGLYQVCSSVNMLLKKNILVRVCDKFHFKNSAKELFFWQAFLKRFLKRASTFGLITFAWIFFAADSLNHAARIVKRMFACNWAVLINDSLYSLGVDRCYTIVMILSITILLLIDGQKYNEKDVVNIILNQDWWLRVIVFASLILVCIVFGCYGEMYDTQQFIYFQF